MTKTRIHSIIATTLIALGGLFLSSLAAVSANASVPIGPGYQIPNPYRDSIIGGYLAPDGTVLYCLEWGAESPTGANDQFTSVASTNTYAGWSHLEIARVNYLITKWGQTRDNNQAAAVAMAIWMRHPGTVDPFFSEHRFVKATIRDASVRASIARQAESMNVEANEFTPHARAALGSVTVTPSPEDPFAGEVRVTGLPANTRGTIVLTGATFDTTDASSAAGVADGDVLRYRGFPKDDELASYRVVAEATFITPGGPGDELVIWDSPPGFQDLGESSKYIPDFEFQLTGDAVVSLQFEPELVTHAANARVVAGQPLVDSIEFSLAAGSEEWRMLSDGTYLAIDGWCQAYGPLKSQPTTSEQPPLGVPLFGEQVRVRVGGTTVPPESMQVEARVAELPKRSGYYTFVCGIDQATQTTVAGQSALPEQYAFQHAFGLVQETTVVSAPLANTGLTGPTMWMLTLAGAAGITFGIALGVMYRRRLLHLH